MKFVFNRDRTIASVVGHVIHFPKGEPVHVPPEMYAEVLGVGGTPDEELDLDAPAAAPDAKQEPVDPFTREKALFAAFEAMIARAKRDDFTSGNLPHPKALAKELGWRVSNQERDLAWVKFNAAK